MSVAARQTTPKGINIYFPPALRAAVLGMCETEDRSISKMVCILLEEALQSRNGKSNGKRARSNGKRQVAA